MFYDAVDIIHDVIITTNPSCLSVLEVIKFKKSNFEILIEHVHSVMYIKNI